MKLKPIIIATVFCALGFFAQASYAGERIVTNGTIVKPGCTKSIVIQRYNFRLDRIDCPGEPRHVAVIEVNSGRCRVFTGPDFIVVGSASTCAYTIERR